MSFGECEKCHGLVLADDRVCRICHRPVVRAGAAGAEPGAGATLPAPVPSPSGGSAAPSLAARLRHEVPTHRRAQGGRRARAAAAPASAPVAAGAGAPAALRARGLTKVYGEGELAVSAVRDVSFEVVEGEIVLVMGPSGSGKTTLLLLLGAMLRPTGGTLHLGGTAVTALPERKLPALRASHLGFVFQDFNLLDALSATENVALACNLVGVRGRRATARAHELLERVGLGHRLDFRPGQLSGGERQRVAIARALANDPPLVLADEPTANLDAAHGREVADLLRRLADEDRRTCLIVTHDDRLTPIADRVLWLEDGTIRPEELR